VLKEEYIDRARLWGAIVLSGGRENRLLVEKLGTARTI
jgi:hypothetical protein